MKTEPPHRYTYTVCAEEGETIMTVNELMEQIRMEMSGDAQTDLHRLSEIAQQYKKEENAAELMAAIADYAVEMLPESTRQEMYDTTFVRNKRMDQAFADALDMIRNDQWNEAEVLLGEIAEKIRVYFEEDEKKWFCFRNQFEYHMYRLYYPEDTVFDRAPFDFSHYLQVYAYVLFQNKKTKAALAAIDRAIAFNPVSIDVRFEQAEIFKFMRLQKQLLECCQASLRISTTASCYARVLGNMGYYCTLVGDLHSAGVFYFESLKFQQNKGIEIELQDVLRRMKTFGQTFAPPTHGQIIDAYEKYGMNPPPENDLVNLAVTLGNLAREHGRTDLEGLFFRTAYDMTQDAEMLARLEEIDKQIAEREKEKEGS